MAGTFVPICGPVVGDTVYVENVLVARDVAITLPEVVPQTADVPQWERCRSDLAAAGEHGSVHYKDWSGFGTGTAAESQYQIT